MTSELPALAQALAEALPGARFTPDDDVLRGRVPIDDVDVAAHVRCGADPGIAIALLGACDFELGVRWRDGWLTDTEIGDRAVDRAYRIVCDDDALAAQWLDEPCRVLLRAFAQRPGIEPWSFHLEGGFVRLTCGGMPSPEHLVAGLRYGATVATSGRRWSQRLVAAVPALGVAGPTLAPVIQLDRPALAGLVDALPFELAYLRRHGSVGTRLRLGDAGDQVEAWRDGVIVEPARLREMLDEAAQPFAMVTQGPYR